MIRALVLTLLLSSCSLFQDAAKVDPIALAESQNQAIIKLCTDMVIDKRISLKDGAGCYRSAHYIGTALDAAREGDERALAVASKMLRQIEADLKEKIQ